MIIGHLLINLIILDIDAVLNTVTIIFIRNKTKLCRSETSLLGSTQKPCNNNFAVWESQL